MGLNDDQAQRLQSVLQREGDTTRFEKTLTPDQLAKFNAFFDGPFNQRDGPFKSWDTDKRLNPEDVAHETDVDLLSSALTTAVERGFDERPNSDRFIAAVIAARRLKELGKTKSDIARYIDRYTTRNSSSQGDKAEFFKSLAAKVNKFLLRQGIDLPEGELARRTVNPVDSVASLDYNPAMQTTPAAESVVKSVEQNPQPSAPSKQPWEMTLKEFQDNPVGVKVGTRQAYYSGIGGTEASRINDLIDRTHLFRVQGAVAAGKPVPLEVAAAYPDILAKLETQRPPAEVLDFYKKAAAKARVVADEMQARWDDTSGEGIKPIFQRVKYLNAEANRLEAKVAEWQTKANETRPTESTVVTPRPDSSPAAPEVSAVQTPAPSQPTPKPRTRKLVGSEPSFKRVVKKVEKPADAAPLMEPEATINDLAAAKKPIDAKLAEDNGLEKQLVEQGYVREGDTYVYKPAAKEVAQLLEAYGDDRLNYMRFYDDWKRAHKEPKRPTARIIGGRMAPVEKLKGVQTTYAKKANAYSEAREVAYLNLFNKLVSEGARVGRYDIENVAQMLLRRNQRPEAEALLVKYGYTKTGEHWTPPDFNSSPTKEGGPENYGSVSSTDATRNQGGNRAGNSEAEFSLDKGSRPNNPPANASQGSGAGVKLEHRVLVAALEEDFRRHPSAGKAGLSPFRAVESPANAKEGATGDAVLQPGGSAADRARTAERLGAGFGKEIVWFTGPAIVDGAYLSKLNPRVIFINAAFDDRAPAMVVAHELSHVMQRGAPDLFQELHNYLMGAISNDAQVRATLSTVYQPREMNAELVAHAVEGVLSKPDMVERILRGNPSLWQRLVTFVKDSWAKLTGKPFPQPESEIGLEFKNPREASQKIERAFSEYKKSIDSQSAQDSEAQYSLNPFRTERAAKAMAEAPGVDAEGRRRIEELAGAQAGDVHPLVRETINQRAFGTPANMAEAHAKRLIRKTADLINVSQTPIDFATIADPVMRQEAADLKVKTHLDLERERAKINMAVVNGDAAMVAAVNDMPKLHTASLQLDVLHALSESLPQDYTRYLENLAKSGKDQSLSQSARSILQRAARDTAKFPVSSTAVEFAIKALAKNTNLMTGEGVTTSDILRQFWHEGGKSGVNPEQTLLLFGDPTTGAGVGGTQPLLARIRNLPAVIDALRVIESGSDKAVQQVQAFQQNFSAKGKAVGVGTAMKRYANLIQQSKAADTIMRTLSANYEKARAQVLGANEAQAMSQDVLDSPQYKQAVQQAAGVLGVQFADHLRTTDGEFRTSGPYPEGSPSFGGKHDFIITRTPTRDALQKNLKESEALIADIESFVNDPNSDPVAKESWKNVGSAIKAQYIDQISSPIESPEIREPFDLKHWVPMMNPLRTLQGLVRDSIGGRESYDLRRHMDALDLVRQKLQDLEMHPTKGLAQMVPKIVAGAKSHGIDLNSGTYSAEQYRSEILNPIANSYQHYGAVRLKPGDVVPGTAHKVTTEDIEALRTVSEFEQAVRKIIEKDADATFNTPTQIMDEFAGKKFSRSSTTTGPMMLSRYWNDEMANWINQNWRTGVEGNVRQEQIAKLHNLMWNDPEMFGTLVRGYVMETNPDFNKVSEFKDDFRKLAAEASKKAIPINNLQDLAAEVARIRNEPVADVLPRLQKSLESEAVRIMDAVAGETKPASNDKGVNAIDRAVASSLKTGGAFLDPRGKMLAPSTFYTIAKVARQDIMSNPAIAVTIGRVRVLRGLKELRESYQRQLTVLEDEIKAATTGGTPKTRREKLNEIDARRKLGEARFTHSQLKRRVTQLKAAVDSAEASLTKFSEILTPGVARTLTAFNRGLSMQLLSSPGAVIRNLFGATYTQDLVLNALFRRSRNILTSPLGVTKEAMRVATGKALGLMNKVNPNLAPAIAKILPFKNEIADFVNHNTEMVKMLTESGQLPPADVLNRIAAKGGMTSSVLQRVGMIPKDTEGVGFGGEILPPGAQVPAHLRATQWALSTPLGLMHEALFPRYFDQAANVVMGHRAATIMLDVFRHADDIADSRTVGGTKLNPLDARQRITAKELGMTEDQLHLFRGVIETVAPLERTMFDYAARLKAADAAGTAITLIGNGGVDIKVLGTLGTTTMDDAKMGAALLNFAKLGNVVSETNAPALFRMNRLMRIFGTFGSWPSNFIDQVMKIAPTSLNTPSQRAKMIPAAIAMAAIAAVATAIQETRRTFLEGYTGKLSAEPTLANVVHDPASPEGMRYMLSALSGGIPYLGMALGQGTDTQNLFDASRMVPLLGFTRDVVSGVAGALKTGDFGKTLFDLSSRYMPFYAPALRQLPGAKEQLAALNSTRALRAATPRSIEMRAVGGGMANPTPISRKLRALELAGYSGNPQKVQSALEDAIAFKMKTKNLTRAQAWSEIRSGLSSRNPEARVFGRKLADTERAQIASRMTEDQSAAYSRGMGVSRNLMGAAPRKSKGGRSPFLPPLAKKKRKSSVYA